MKQAEDIRNIEIKEKHNPGFFERVIGPTNDAVLGRLAVQMGKEVVGGGFFDSPTLDFNYQGLKCKIVSVLGLSGDSFEFIVDYKPSDHFSLRVDSEGILSGIRRLLGASSDFEIGDEEYDKAFLLDSNDDARLKAICNKRNIKNAMLDAGFCRLVAEDSGSSKDVPNGMRRLRYTVEGGMGSVATLNYQLQAFADMIDGLFRTGCVTRKEPAGQIQT